ncbi:MAG TPA: hypothetical protein VN704_04745 [Verrucomicrobiae bacterium]|nr:hypothetical protein [Verrucomicrobiae bacterium]
MKSRSKKPDESQPHIAIIIPFKTKTIKFKPIPIEYISGDGKEELCIINETLKIDATGITTTEIINDFIKKFLENWDRFQKNEPVKNYLYTNTPNISPDGYHDLKMKYSELVEN